LLSFNLGLEVGQIFVIAVIMFVSFIFLNMIKISQKFWVWTLSAVTFYVACNMAIDRWPL
jgi:hypothetical protein